MIYRRHISRGLRGSSWKPFHTRLALIISKRRKGRCAGDGQIMNADPFQYRLPALKDLPALMQTSVLEAGDGPGPFGSKGMSQTTIVTVAPAIGNAIYDAIGARVRSLPITPEKILAALGKIPGKEMKSSIA